MQVGILGTGSRKGGILRLTRDIESELGMAPGSVERLCGVTSRPVIDENESQESLACDAAQIALQDAGIQPNEIDLILFASAVGRQPIPATAALVKRELGLEGQSFPAIDVNITCLSALAAMEIAALYIGAGRASHVLVIASEIATRALPWRDDPATAALFGDGAGAVVLGKAAETGDRLQLRDVAIETWVEGYDMCELAAGGTRFDFHAEPEDFERHSYFRMEGHALFKLTRNKVPKFIDRLLARMSWRRDDVDVVIPHQASPIALEHMIRRCGFARDKVISTVHETGNLVAASLPMTLDLARREGLIFPGAKILMVGTSAGVSIGGATLQA